MNFQSIEYFLTTAKERSITRAAEKLHITQQTLSAQIASLERELGCPLFIRHVPLELTYAGTVFLNYAGTLRHSYRDMQQEFHDIVQNQKGILRIGITPTRGNALLPHILPAFRRKYPLIEIDVNENENAALPKELLSGSIDLAIANFPPKPGSIKLENFYEEEICLLVSETLLQETFGEEARNRLEAVRSANSLAPFSALPFLLNHEQNIAGRIAMTLFSAAGFHPQIAAQSRNIELLLQLCAGGVGACFCPDRLIMSTLSASQLSKLHLIRLCRQDRYWIHFGWSADAYQSRMLLAFIETAKACCREESGFSTDLFCSF